MLLQNPDDLLIGKPGSSHRLSPSSGIRLTLKRGHSRGAGHLDKTFTRKRALSIEKYAENSFGVFQEEPVNVVWKFSPNAAQDASEFLFHPSQKLEPQKDGSLMVSFRAGGLLEMCWHLFTWGGEVEVIKPKRLVSMLQQEVAK